MRYDTQPPPRTTDKMPTAVNGGGEGGRRSSARLVMATALAVTAAASGCIVLLSAAEAAAGRWKRTTGAAAAPRSKKRPRRDDRGSADAPHARARSPPPQSALPTSADRHHAALALALLRDGQHSVTSIVRIIKTCTSSSKIGIRRSPSNSRKPLHTPSSPCNSTSKQANLEKNHFLEVKQTVDRNQVGQMWNLQKFHGISIDCTSLLLLSH